MYRLTKENMVYREMHAILITFSISQVIQAGLAIYLWFKLHQKYPLMIEASPVIPSAPDYTTSKEY
jgi:hypothetical protein